MFSSFLYSLAGGMLAVLATGRPDQIAWRFVRLIGLIAFAVLVLPLVWRFRAADSGSVGGFLEIAAPIVAALSAIAVAGLAPAFDRLGRAFRVVSGIGGLAGLTAGFLAARDLMTTDVQDARMLILVIAGQVLGSLLLGSITVAWLLGHAYLTATKMTLAPLRHFSQVLLWVIGIRAAFFVFSVATAWTAGSAAWRAFVVNADYSMLTWVFVSLRVGVGLVAVGVFAWMVRDCVRLRATQSATGILYFGSVFAYVGELCGQQLLAQYGWPV